VCSALGELKCRESCCNRFADCVWHFLFFGQGYPSTKVYLTHLCILKSNSQQTHLIISFVLCRVVVSSRHRRRHVVYASSITGKRSDIDEVNELILSGTSTADDIAFTHTKSWIRYHQAFARLEQLAWHSKPRDPNVAPIVIVYWVSARAQR
jgi:hypothetical protein